MSLLNRGTEVVTVYPEVTVTDSDGNQFTKADSMGIVTKASVQPISSSENTNGGGFNTISRYRLRLAGGWPTGGGILGAQAIGGARGTRSTGTPNSTPAAAGPPTRSSRWSECDQVLGRRAPRPMGGACSCLLDVVVPTRIPGAALVSICDRRRGERGG